MHDERRPRTQWNQRRAEEQAHTAPRHVGMRGGAPNSAPSPRHARQEPLSVADVSRSSHRGASPRLVSYQAEDKQTYRLHDLVAGDEAQVAKRRAAPEPFPPSREQRAAGAGLLRLSGYALIGALLGGAPGAALGALVALVALVRLLAFERRARSWRARAKKNDAARRLPATATNERLRLMTALWQSAGAAILGMLVLALLLTAVR